MESIDDMAIKGTTESETIAYIGHIMIQMVICCFFFPSFDFFFQLHVVTLHLPERREREGGGKKKKKRGGRGWGSKAKDKRLRHAKSKQEW